MPTQLHYNEFTFDPPTWHDLDGLFAINNDPAVWTHDPDYRHTTPDRTRDQLQDSLHRWTAIGLDYWIIHNASGAVVGSAGARLLEHRWNLFARLSPTAQGRGLAAATLQAAIDSAQNVAPQLPVVARLRTTNDPSRRLVERVGLLYRFTVDSVDDGPAWLVYADRELDQNFHQIMRY